MEVIVGNSIISVNNGLRAVNLKHEIAQRLNILVEEFYLLENGKLIPDEKHVSGGTIRAVFRNLGGKGGFGSMLRAIGAQIEKTTNREACRDLSGRRLRDINEEERLKNWIAAQAEREKEKADRRQKKLERLCAEPKHEFKDSDYDKERSMLPEKVEDAVMQGLKVATKRKVADDKGVTKKRMKLWVDADLEDDLSSSDEEKEKSEEEAENSSSSSSIEKHGECSK